MFISYHDTRLPLYCSHAQKKSSLVESQIGVLTSILFVPSYNNFIPRGITWFIKCNPPPCLPSTTLSIWQDLPHYHGKYICILFSIILSPYMYITNWQIRQPKISRLYNVNICHTLPINKANSINITLSPPLPNNAIIQRGLYTNKNQVNSPLQPQWILTEIIPFFCGTDLHRVYNKLIDPFHFSTGCHNCIDSSVVFNNPIYFLFLENHTMSTTKSYHVISFC